MDCPVCEEAMITLEISEMEVDFCTSCLGIWLDGGELELMLEDAEQAVALLRSFEAAENDPIRRKCPICDKVMKRLNVGLGSDVTIDKCVKDHGLWFDSGELPQILEKAQLDKDHKIQKTLAEIFQPE